MRTIETTAVIEPDGKLILQLPPDIPPGEHRIVLVIDETAVSLPDTPMPPLQLQVFDWPNWPDEATFRREDIYDDDGR